MSLTTSKWLRYKVLFPGIACLPHRIGYRIADWIGRQDFRHHRTRVAVERGMCSLLPSLCKDNACVQSLSVKHFQMLAKDTLDCYFMPRFTPSNTRNLIRVNNIDALTEAQAAGRGVIMIISHYGRFFMLGPGLKFAGVEFGMLTTMVDERHPTYEPVDRWYMAKKLRNTQMFSRGSWIVTADGPREIYRSLKSGEIMLIALDGNETGSDTRVSFPFFSGTLSLPEGIVRIASYTGAKLVYAVTQDVGSGVEITLHSLPDDPQAALGKAVNLLAQDIQKTPWHWWMWPGLNALWRSDSNLKNGENSAQ